MSLVIDKIHVKLQKDDILHEVSLEINEGEFVSLFGESGCGKTTLLKSIAGLLEIESGDILWDGASIKKIPAQKRGTVIVFQDLRLFPHLSVEKNIAFPMELRKVPKDVQKKQVKELLSDVQLDGYEKRRVQEISGGQMQRVALARALAAEPKVLLLDEPFSGLDEKLRIQMGNLIRHLHKEKNLTTVLVTHDKREALQLSDNIAQMHEGNIIRYDTPRATMESLGRVSFIKGIVANGKFSQGSTVWDTDCKDGAYEVGIPADGTGMVYFNMGDIKNEEDNI